MRILLVAMPDSVGLINSLVQSPNMGIVSLAGNLKGHEVRCLDLVGCRDVGTPVRKALADFCPQIVGLSAMTFQFSTLLKTAALVRKLSPAILTAAGGYHVSLMFEELAKEDDLPLDFMIRGEGEATFRELADAIASGRPDFEKIRGLSHREDRGRWFHAPPRELAVLGNLEVPDRSSRLRDDFKIFGRLSWDVLETSRGCYCSCNFCSIGKMYGKTFRKYPMERIERDWKGVSKSKDAVFIVDDNVGLDRDHLMELCGLLGTLNRNVQQRSYIIQLSAQTIAASPDVIALMGKAGFKLVFVGFETMDMRALSGVSKPSSPELNREAARILRANGMTIVAGCIFGFPDDGIDSIRESFDAIIDLRPDIIYPQYLTPYPGTVLRGEMEAMGLIESNDFSRYDGYTCNVKTKKLSNSQLRRALQKEILKSFFNPKLLIGNRAVLKFPSLVLPFASNLISLARDIIKDQDPPRQKFIF